MIIRCYRLNACPCFFLCFYFYFYFYFLFFFFLGGGVPKNKKTSICIMDIHNSQQLWISIIALWVNMFTWLWIPMFRYDSPLWLPTIQLWISIKIIRIWISKIQLWISVIQSWISMIIGFIRTWLSISPLSPHTLDTPDDCRSVCYIRDTWFTSVNRNWTLLHPCVTGDGWDFDQTLWV